MYTANLNGIKIQAVAAAVPTFVDDLSRYREKYGSESVDKFKAMTGVKQRRLASNNQTSSDFAYIAAKKIMEEENIAPEEIATCVFVSQTTDYPTPATACVLQKRLGLPLDCLCFDVNLGCSGFVYGVNIAASLMKTNGINKGLVLVGDTTSRIYSDDDRSGCMLFGDSGAAALLAQSEDSEMLGAFKSDGYNFKAIIQYAGGFRNRGITNKKTLWADGNIRSDYDSIMHGDDVFLFTISEVPEMIKEHLEDIRKTADDFDTFVLHQANDFILKRIAKKCKIPVEKIPVSLDRFGNTSVTSIPLTLCDAYGDKDGEINALMCGFGIGLSWGIITTKINAAHIYPIIETDDYYTEGAVSHD